MSLNFWDLMDGLAVFDRRLAKRIVAGMLLAGLLFAPKLVGWMLGQAVQKETATMDAAARPLADSFSRLAAPTAAPPAAPARDPNYPAPVVMRGGTYEGR